MEAQSLFITIMVVSVLVFSFVIFSMEDPQKTIKKQDEFMEDLDEVCHDPYWRDKLRELQNKGVYRPERVVVQEYREYKNS